jgi:hypothetical protein
VSIGQQNRKTFGLAYKTALGNDTDGVDHGYKLHLVYGALAAPSEKAYQTINDSPDAIVFSWEITTTPVSVTGKKPTASLTINSTKVDAAKLASIEDILFGTDSVDARLPLPDEIATLFAGSTVNPVALSTIVPADDATAIAINSNITLTFNNKISREAVVVASEAGVIIPGTKSWDSTGKVLTFNPTADLTANTMYLVTVGGVVDIYGQALAAEVKNFTTAA